MNSKVTKKPCPECGKLVAKVQRHRQAVHGVQNVGNAASENAEEDIIPASLDQDQPSTSTTPSTNTCLDEFKEWMKCPEGGNVSQKTADTYRSCMRRVLLFIGCITTFKTEFNKIGQSSFLKDTGVSASSLKPWFCALRKFIRFLQKKQMFVHPK